MHTSTFVLNVWKVLSFLWLPRGPGCSVRNPPKVMSPTKNKSMKTVRPSFIRPLVCPRLLPARFGRQGRSYLAPPLSNQYHQGKPMEIQVLWASLMFINDLFKPGIYITCFDALILYNHNDADLIITITAFTGGQKHNFTQSTFLSSLFWLFLIFFFFFFSSYVYSTKHLFFSWSLALHLQRSRHHPGAPAQVESRIFGQILDR